MDWLLVSVIAGAAFWLGDIIGYIGGRKDERERAALQRRLDELT